MSDRDDAPVAGAGAAQPALARILPFRQWWPRVTRQTLRADAIAGLSGAMLGLPQGVAFAILAGLPPQYGLYAAMIPPALAALFGSSHHMVAGPTNAIAILLFASLAPIAPAGTPDYIRLVLTVTFLTGVFELAMGIARLGALVNFISHTVLIGFSTGAAILIATSQIKSFFGLPIPAEASFIETLRQLALQLPHLNPYVTAVGAFTLLAGILARRYLRRVPYMISATIAGSVFAVALDALFSHRTGIRMVGALPPQLPPLSLPDLSLDTLAKTAPTALANTILALTLAIGVGRSLALRSGQRIDSNQEFIGQGISNVVGSFFSSFPSAGSFNRSGANYEAGAKTPLASVFSSVALALIVLVVAPLAAYLPYASVAAILFLIAHGLIDVKRMRAVLRTDRAEAAVMIVTLASALFLGLATAIYAGVLLSLLLFLNRAARPGIRDVKPEYRGGVTFNFDADTGLPDCPQLKMLRINGSIFFGAVEHIEDAFHRVDAERPSQKHLLIVASGINLVDISGAELLVREAKRRRAIGGGLYFYFMKDAVREILERGGYLDAIGRENIFSPRDDVIAAIYARLDPEICRRSAARIFPLCNIRLPNGEARVVERL